MGTIDRRGNTHTEDFIRIRAYELWEREGRPDGRHEEHWHMASNQAQAGVIYEIVEHNGGFAYRLGDVFSETFGTHAAAREAAEQAAQRQQLPGPDEQIEYQDSDGKWHEEFSPGDDKPEATMADPLPPDLEARDPTGRALSEEELPSPDLAPLPDMHRRERSGISNAGTPGTSSPAGKTTR